MRVNGVLLISVLLFACGCNTRSMQRFVDQGDDQLRHIGRVAKVENIVRDVVWVQVEEMNLTLDVFYPDGGPHPMVVNIHGGGWIIGSKEQDEALCRYVAQQGYTVFNINYRLAPQHPFPRR